jgi:predicted membrane-bound spermidine synthase
MQKSIYVAVGMNGAVAIGAMAVYMRTRRSAAAAEAPVEAKPPRLAAASVLILSFLSGLVSLSYEIFFYRTMSYITGSAAHAFAFTLGAFLMGLASGARQAGRYCEAATRGGRDPIGHVVADLMMASLLGFLFLPFLGHLAYLGGVLQGIAILFVFLIARRLGILLPYLADLGVAADEYAGINTAWLYMANICGSAAGCIFTGFVLMDHLSLVAIARTLVLMGLACALLLVLTKRMKGLHNLISLAGCVALGGLAVFCLPPLTRNVLEDLLRKDVIRDSTPFAQIVENRNGIIALDKTGIVYGDGAYDGRFNTDLVKDTNGIFRPYALSLFHPNPHDVLMIGLGTGSWAEVIANNPYVSSLTIVEINPGYLRLIGQAPEVAPVLANPKVSIVVDDGRRWLRFNASRRFDAIVQNTTFHFRSNTSNLLSIEFMEIVRKHLNPGGIFFFNTTDSARAQRTACLAFPSGARFANHMVVSNSPIAWDFSRWKQTLEAYRVEGKAVLDESRPEDRTALERMIGLSADLGAEPRKGKNIESCKEIISRTEGLRPITDDNMGTEWRYTLFRTE